MMSFSEAPCTAATAPCQTMTLAAVAHLWKSATQPPAAPLHDWILLKCTSNT